MDRKHAGFWRALSLQPRKLPFRMMGGARSDVKFRPGFGPRVPRLKQPRLERWRPQERRGAPLLAGFPLGSLRGELGWAMLGEYMFLCVNLGEVEVSQYPHQPHSRVFDGFPRGRG